MDEKASFIPKKTLTRPVYAESKFSFFSFVSFLLLIISILILGGTYFYKGFLNKKTDTLFDSLKRAEDMLDPVFIEQMKSLDGKIETAKTLLAQHKMPTAIFEFLEQSTIKTVRFSNFDLSVNSPKDLGGSPEIVLNLSGIANSYASLALQSREFQKNENVKNIILSGLSLGERGDVKFSAQIIIDPGYLIYGPK